MSLETVIKALNSGIVTKSGYVLDPWMITLFIVFGVVIIPTSVMFFMKLSNYKRLANVKLDTIQSTMLISTLTMIMTLMPVMVFNLGNQELIADTYVKDLKVVKEDINKLDNESFKVLSDVLDNNKGKDTVKVWVNDTTYGKMTLDAVVKRDVSDSGNSYLTYRKLDKSLVLKKTTQTLYNKGWVSVELHVPKYVKDDAVFSYVNELLK